MIEDIYLSPSYWIALALVMLASVLLTRSRILDFKFVALGFLSQYVVHSVLAFGISSSIAIFCILFWALFVGLLNPWVQKTLLAAMGALAQKTPLEVDKLRAREHQWKASLHSLERPWLFFARWFLILYWSARVLFFPYLAGELELNERLAAGQENRFLFFLGLVVLPAIAACAAVWVRKGYRFKLIDYVVLLVVVVGYLGTGSKIAVLPVVLLYFGAVSFFNRPWREMRMSLILAGIGAVLVGLRLVISVPAGGLLGVAQQTIYRFVANTDSLDYLKAIGVAPGEYPFAGPGSLAPMFLKPFGLEYNYSPGVWLHGTRFGEWQGYGPNPGIVMDYFANLGWFGLCVAVFAAIYMWVCVRIGGVIGCSFISIAYLLFVDVTLFDIPFVFWVGVLVALTVGVSCFRTTKVQQHVARIRSRFGSSRLRGGHRRAKSSVVDA